MQILSTLCLILGLAFIAIGSIALLKLQGFYKRILFSSLIDTCGVILILTGIILKNPISFFSVKVALLLVTILLLNPVSTHYIAKSAYYSGHPIGKENIHD